MYIPQQQLKNLIGLLKPQKAVIVYGPRRCGKTTLLNKLVEAIETDHLMVSGEDIHVRDLLGGESIERLRGLVGRHRLLIIDEAQKVKGIGLNIKLILDHVPGVQVVASGSSSFDLARQVGEPLTGRKFTIRMFPLAQMELSQVESRAQTEARLGDRLIYGSYPEVVLAPDDRERARYLSEIVGSYLYKDVLELDGLRQSDKLLGLLRCLAFQIGKEVSYSELGTQLSMSKNTVERYLDLLQKAFVIFKLGGFSRNLRKEIVKSPRFFFYDTGIRNALINNFNPMNLRDDVGMLWENYVIMEMIKRQEYQQRPANNYFWRTYDRREIDLIEESEGRLRGYEVKWSRARSKSPAEWLAAYPNADCHVISRDNYLDLIT